MHFKKFSSVPGLYPLDASAVPPLPPPPVLTTRNAAGMAKFPLRGKILTYPPFKTTVLEIDLKVPLLYFLIPDPLGLI